MIPILALVALAKGDEIADYVQTVFRDAAFRAKIVDKDLGALESISRDFGQGYRLGDLDVRLKEPFKVRADAKVEDSSASFVVNGLVRAYKLPHLKPFKLDLAKRPGNRQTVMEFGVLTPSLFTDLFDARFVRREPLGQAVFDLTFKPVYEDATRHRVWIDPKTRTLAKREWYDRKGRLMAVFLFENPRSEAGASLPTRMTVTNAEGKKAGVTLYDRIRLNRGIDDAVFAI